MFGLILFSRESGTRVEPQRVWSRYYVVLKRLAKTVNSLHYIEWRDYLNRKQVVYRLHKFMIAQ